jgi:hypothetical protein
MNLLELYCHVDEFVKAFLPEWNKHLIIKNKAHYGFQGLAKKQ